MSVTCHGQGEGFKEQDVKENGDDRLAAAALG